MLYSFGHSDTSQSSVLGPVVGPYTFNRISDFVVCCGEREGVSGSVNYLDDFAVIGHIFNNCSLNQSILATTLPRVGFYLSYPKLLPP